MNFDEWVKTIPQEITSDSLWKMEAYRLALFAAEIGWQDVLKLTTDRRMLGLSDQLYRSLGSVSANLAEGYSRGMSKERAHFYEYALGSGRESRDWYYKSRHLLGDAVVFHRIRLMTQIIRLLLSMIPQQRGNLIREQSVEYEIKMDDSSSSTFNLLKNIPFAEDKERYDVKRG